MLVMECYSFACDNITKFAMHFPGFVMILLSFVMTIYDVET